MPKRSLEGITFGRCKPLPRAVANPWRCVMVESKDLLDAIWSITSNPDWTFLQAVPMPGRSRCIALVYKDDTAG
jgi:hypothetical protein